MMNDPAKCGHVCAWKDGYVDRRTELTKSIMDEALLRLAEAERLQYVAHLLRESEDFNEENGCIMRGRPKGSKDSAPRKRRPISK